MIVHDNFLDKFDFESIANTISNKDTFAWFLLNGVVDEDEKDKFQFTHMFHNGKINSPFFSLLAPIFCKIKPKKLLRIKANLQARTSKIITHSWHTDFQEQCTTGIFYLNTCNGYTEFKKPKKKVKSKGNRFVEFDSDTEHRGTTCTDYKYRIVINFNYLK